jgi:hypothetical protein
MLSRYTDRVGTRITVSVDAEVLRWARWKAADENTSVSKLISRLLSKEKSDAYWRGYEEWKRLSDDLGVSIEASKRFSRDEAHERR